MKKVNFCKFSTFIITVYLVLGISGLNTDLITYSRIVLFGLWLLSIALEDKSAINRILSDKLVRVLNLHLLSYILLLMLSANFYAIIKLLLSRLLIFSPVYVFSYYKNSSENKKLFSFTIVIWTYYCLKSIMFYFNNPGAARGLAANQTLYADISLGGGYSLAFGASLFAVILLQYLLSKAHHFSKRTKLFLFALFLINFILCIETVSVITIVSIIVGCATVLWFTLFSFNGRKGAWIISLFSTSALVLFLISKSKDIGEYIVSNTSSKTDVFNRRIHEIGLVLSGSFESASDMSVRTEKIFNSFTLFFNSPLLGTGYIYGFDYISSNLYGVGLHSEFADILALYGVICGGFILYVYFKNIISIITMQIGNAKYAYVICFLIMFVFNPFATFQSHIMFFYIIPSFVLLVKNKNLLRQINEVQG